MSICTAWSNPEHTVITHTFEGRWSWQEFFDAWKQTQMMMQDCVRPVVTIVDMGASAGVPDYSFEPLRRVISHRPDRHSALTIIVQAGLPIQRFWRMFAQCYPKATEKFNIRFVESMEEAWVLAEQQHRAVAGTQP